jgi:glutathione synthase/RimK-type ligase-like ATP-grasp enzyme
VKDLPVLILSNQDDVHADIVGARLESMDVPYLRADPGRTNDDFNYVFQSSGEIDTDRVIMWQADRPAIDPDQQRSVLVRRISPQSELSGAGPNIQRFQAAETTSALGGIFSTLTSRVPWFNHPYANQVAGDKIAQLRCARQVDLSVPATMVTNDPSHAFDFYEEFSRDIVVKSLSPLAAPQEVVPALFTTRVPADLDRAAWASVVAGSSILQQRVPKTADVRVAVVGDRLLACRIESQALAETSTDWRTNGEVLDHQEIVVPPAVGERLRRLRRQLGLRLMHVDFCVDQQDQWWFLEANPNGQWLWLELNAGLPVSHAIAEQLADPLRAIV